MAVGGGDLDLLEEMEEVSPARSEEARYQEWWHKEGEQPDGPSQGHFIESRFNVAAKPRTLLIPPAVTCYR